MELGDLVIYSGRTCYLRGLEPISVPDPLAELEDAATGESLSAPLEEISLAAPDAPPGAV